MAHMIASLCCVSSQASWILCDDSAQNLVASRAWNEDESFDMSLKLAPEFEALLTDAKTSRSALSALFCVSGPGAFTGLRVSASFMLGLAQALKLKLHGIPTFDLLGSPFWIPLQHQRVKKLSFEDALKSGVEFLEIHSADDAAIGKPAPSDAERCFGVGERALWPSHAALLRAVRKNCRSSTPPFAIQYGLNPKIAGQRS